MSLTLRVQAIMDLALRDALGDGGDGSVQPPDSRFRREPGVVDGPAMCRMFNQVIAGAPTLPQQLSSDHDPLFQSHRWKANLRILEVSEIKTVPHVRLSHPFVERVG